MSQLLLFVCTVWSMVLLYSRSPSKFTFSFDNKTNSAFQPIQLVCCLSSSNRLMFKWMAECCTALTGNQIHWMKLGDEYVSTLHYQLDLCDNEELNWLGWMHGFNHRWKYGLIYVVFFFFSLFSLTGLTQLPSWLCAFHTRPFSYPPNFLYSLQVVEVKFYWFIFPCF